MIRSRGEPRGQPGQRHAGRHGDQQGLVRECRSNLLRHLLQLMRFRGQQHDLRLLDRLAIGEFHPRAGKDLCETATRFGIGVAGHDVRGRAQTLRHPSTDEGRGHLPRTNTRNSGRLHPTLPAGTWGCNRRTLARRAGAATNRGPTASMHNVPCYGYLASVTVYHQLATRLTAEIAGRLVARASDRECSKIVARTTTNGGRRLTVPPKNGRKMTWTLRHTCEKLPPAFLVAGYSTWPRRAHLVRSVSRSSDPIALPT